MRGKPIGRRVDFLLEFEYLSAARGRLGAPNAAICIASILRRFGVNVQKDGALRNKGH